MLSKPIVCSNHFKIYASQTIMLYAKTYSVVYGILNKFVRKISATLLLARSSTLQPLSDNFPILVSIVFLSILVFPAYICMFITLKRMSHF